MAEPILDVPIIGASTSTPADAVVAAPLLAAVDLVSPARDVSERVVAVDEFRAREAASSKPERAWPRVPDRPAFDKPLDLQRPELDLQSSEKERVVSGDLASSSRSSGLVVELLVNR